MADANDEEEAEIEYSYEPEANEKKSSALSDAAFIRSVSSQRQVFSNCRLKKKNCETPMEKLQRLKYEVQQLTKDLDTVTSGSNTNAESAKASVCIAEIETHFSNILCDSRIAPYLSKDVPLNKSGIANEQSECAGALIDQLKDFGGGGGKQGVEYNLYKNENLAGDHMRLIELDRQIGALETNLGSIGSTEKTGFSEINSALSDLYRKLELLDGHKLESVQRRISNLGTEIEILEGNMPKLRGKQTSAQKFEELYTYMKKWDDGTRELPGFILRLESQVSVHRESAQTLLRMQKLGRQQLALNNLLTQDREALTKANASIGTNLTIMNNNIKNFKKRFAELEKKIKKC